MNSQVKEVFLDIRNNLIVITGQIQNGKYGSVLFQSQDSFTYKLNTKQTYSLYITKDKQPFIQTQAYTGEPAFKFSGFMQNDKQQFEAKIGTEKLVKNKDELIDIVVQQVKNFIFKFIADDISLIYLVHSDDVHQTSYDLLKQKIVEKFNIFDSQIIRKSPEKFLSCDFGTGYYMAMVHDVIGNYDVHKLSFDVDKNGVIHYIQNCSEKVWSDVYFDPNFDLNRIPRLLSQKNYEEIISNTSLSVPRVDGWIQAKHYKACLYESNQRLVFDAKQLKSHVQIFLDNYHKQVDTTHLFLIIMTHVYHAIQTLDKKIGCLRISVPVSATKEQEGFMLGCASAVFKDMKIDITSEPEAAFSYLMTQEKAEETFDVNEHIVLTDGGDGTFDNIYVKKFIDKSGEQDMTIWSKKHQQAFAYAGAKMYLNFKSLMEQVFKERSLEVTALINDMYEQYKKKSGTTVIDDQFSMVFKGNQKFRCIINSIIQEMKNKKVFTITSKQAVDESKLKTDVQEQNKFLQTLQLEMPPLQCAKIQEPIQTYIDHFLEVIGNVKNIMQKNGDGDSKIHVVFVGGLARNISIVQRFQEVCAKEGMTIQLADEPQVAIIKGIPVQRANISLRNFDEKTKHNLYILEKKAIEGIKLSTKLKIAYGEKEFQLSGCNPVTYGTTLLWEKGSSLAPGNNQFIKQRRLLLNSPNDLFFYKSEKDDVPPFLSLNKNGEQYVFDQKGMRILNDSNLHHVQILIVPEELPLFVQDNMKSQRVVGGITTELHIVLDHKKFHPHPVIQLYQVSTTRQTKVLFKEIEFFDWFNKPAAENNYTYVVQNK